MAKAINTAKFREELVRIMPGYKWTVRRPWTKNDYRYMEAEGSQSAGFNRMSTLRVVRRKVDDKIEYEVKSAGFGMRVPWCETYKSRTLALALRGLQNKYKRNRKHHEDMARHYGRHEMDLEQGRKAA